MTNMNMDVTVRLHDEMTRGARNVERAIERIARAAQPLSSRNNASSSVRGLARAMQQFNRDANATTQTTNAIDRLASAVGRMVQHTTGLKQSVSGIRSLSSAVTKLSRLSREFNDAAQSVDRLNSALRQVPNTTSGFLSGATTQLRTLITLQNQAITNMNRLNNGGGGGRGRRGRGGGGGGNGGGGGGGNGGGGHGNNGYPYDMHITGGIARHAMSASMDAEDEITNARAQGFSEADISRIKQAAQRNSELNPSTTYAGNIKSILETRLAMAGNLNEALGLLPDLSNIATILSRQGKGEDAIKGGQEAVYSAARSAELRNLIVEPGSKDPEKMRQRFRSLLSAIMTSNVVSNGLITPKMWASNLQYARTAGLGFDDEFVNSGVVPFMMQELTNGGRGARSGTAGHSLLMALQTMRQGRISLGKGQGEEWIAQGELTRSDFDKKGQLRAGHRPKDMDLYVRNPLEFFNKQVETLAKRKEISTTNRDEWTDKDRRRVLNMMATMFPNITSQTAGDILTLQSDRIAAFVNSMKMAGNGDPNSIGRLMKLYGNTQSMQLQRLNAAYNDLLATITGPFVPALTSAVRGLHGFTKGTQEFLHRVIGPSDPNSPGMNGGQRLALMAGGSAFIGWMMGFLLARAPQAGILLGQAFVGVVTASPVAAFLSRGTFAAISTALASQSGVAGRILAGVFAPEVGTAMAAAFVAYVSANWVTKGIASIRDSFKSDAEAKGDIEANRAGYEKWKRIYDDPKTTPFARRSAYKNMLSAQKYLEDRGASLAGKRAAGGPVGAGKTYLVGERGPELFTPGSSGGIVNNAALQRLGRGTDYEPVANILAAALRSQTFSLASAIYALGARLSRTGNGGGGGFAPAADGGAHEDGVFGRKGFALRGRPRSSGSSGGGGAAPKALSKLAQAGITDRPVNSGLDEFNVYGFKHRGAGIRPVDPNGFASSSAVAAALNPRLAASRKAFFDELDQNPQLRRDVIKTASMENGRSSASMTSVLESMVNRAQMRGYHSLNQSIHDGFYGPVNRGGLKGALSEAARKYGEQAIANVRAGSNNIGYRTDQGLLTDPGARKYMLEPDKSGWKKFQGENFFYMGQKGRAWAKQQEELDRAGSTTVGAFGLSGPNYSNAPRAQVPASAKPTAKPAANPKVSQGGTMHVGAVHINVHGSPHHDPKQIAAMVHEKFNESVRSQLSDGAYV